MYKVSRWANAKEEEVILGSQYILDPLWYQSWNKDDTSIPSVVSMCQAVNLHERWFPVAYTARQR